MQYYSDANSGVFRMGDIVRGFVLGAARQKKPDQNPRDYQVSLCNPDFSVILTPCCSIGDKTLALAPLLHVNPTWLENPYFKKDLTNINREMQPEQAVSQKVWERLGDQERKQRLQSGKANAFLEWFVYPPHQVIGKYKLKSQKEEIEMGYYAVDFRLTFRVECEAVANTKQVPIDAKVLELSIEARNELRLKLSSYFGRVPNEDVI